MRRTAIAISILLLAAGWLAGQTRSLVGTVTGIRPETAEIEIKPDNAPPVIAKFTADTIAQRVAPGETDLKKAAAIQVTEVAIGDRVLADHGARHRQRAADHRDVGQRHR